jgi:ribonuclease E
MSRQRIRASVLESTMQPCPHCGGTGHIRSESSVALLVLRAIEEFLLKDSRFHVTVHTPGSTALYMLNHKRSNLTDLERRFGLTITIEMDESVASQHYAIFKAAAVDRSPTAPAAPVIEPPALEMDEDADDEVGELDLAEAEQPSEPRAAEEQHGGEHRKRRRRRRRRGGRDRDAFNGDGEHAHAAPAADADHEEEDGEVEAASEPDAQDNGGQADQEGKRRRRGKRGGRRNRRPDESEGGPFAGQEGGDYEQPAEDAPEPAADQPATAETVTEEAAVLGAPEGETAPAAMAEAVEPAPAKPARRSRKKAAVAEESASEAAAEAAPKPARRSRKKAEPAAEAVEPEAVEPAAEAEVAEAAPQETARPAPKAPAEPVVTVVSENAAQQPANGDEAEGRPRKAGWWQRKSFF